MDRDNENQTSPAEEKINSPSEPVSSPREEPIVLNKLFPDFKQNVDALFPDGEMKRLLRDVVRSRQKNERFLKRIHIDEDIPEEDPEDTH